jgi:hypothetical protein
MRLSACVILCGLALQATYLRIAQLGDLRQHAEAFLAYFSLAFLVYLGLVWVVRRAAPRLMQPPRWLLIGVTLGAVAFRLTLLGLSPTLSDDVYRYVWDGRVQQAGINPYRYAPDDPALRALRDESWGFINHKDIPTVYPPLMQLAFRLGAWMAPTVLMQKAVFLACDLAIVVLLVVLLPRWGASPFMSLIYAWHPLVVVEVAASGHNDPLGVLLLLLGLAFWHGRRRAMGTAVFALSFLSKFTTLLLWPFYAVRARKLLLVFLAVVLIGSLPCWGSPHFRPGLWHYARPWEFNSSLYHVLNAWLGNPFLVRLLGALAVIATGWIVAARHDDVTGYTLVVIQAAILVTPVLEPWYLLWLIPLLCLRPSWMWLVFSGLVAASYLALVRFAQEGIWAMPAWVRWVEYAPLYAVLLVKGLRKFHEGQRHHSRV